MKYIIVMQFVPGMDAIWVERLSDSDPTYYYDTLEEAELKMSELKAADPTRGFKIITR